MGLVLGLGRSSAIGLRDIALETRFGSTVGARHHALLNSCPSDMILAVHELFLRRNSDLLKAVHLPWYIPEQLGGVGLKPLITEIIPWDVDEPTIRSYNLTSTGHKCGPSRSDVMIAFSLIDHRHREFHCRSIPTSQPVQARSIWQQAFFNSKRSKSEVEDSESSFLDLATYYLTPSRVMRETTLEESLAVLRHNERCWTSLSLIMGDLSEGIDLFL